MKKDNYFNDVITAIKYIDCDEIDLFINHLSVAYIGGKNIYIIGNGGSNKIANHFEVDFSNRVGFGLRVRSLANLGIITAIGNDDNFNNVFSNQLGKLCNNDDILLALSTSGESNNILKAIEVANAKGMKTISIGKANESSMSELSKYHIGIKSEITEVIEDVMQIICHYVSYTSKHIIRGD